MASKLAKIHVPIAAHKGRTWNSLAAGGTQVLDEPAVVVGLHSHEIKATLDENGKRDPEILTVTNPGKQQSVPAKYRTGKFKGAIHAALGVSIQAAGGNIQTGPGAQIGGTASEPDRTALTAAQRNANAVSQQYLNQQSAANQASQQEAARVQAASRNTADLAAVAGATNRQQNQDSSYEEFGVNAPAGVVVRPGAAPLGNTPGVRQSYQTQQEIEQAQANENATNRGFSLESGRIAAGTAGLAASSAGIDYADAQSRRSSGGGGVDTGASVRAEESRMAQIRAAGTRAGMSTGNGYGKGAGGNYTGSSFGPDAYTGGVGRVTGPQNDDEFQAQYRHDQLATPGTSAYLGAASQKAGNQVVEDPTTGPEFGTPQRYTYANDLNARTDTAGNVNRGDGTYLDPKSRNVFSNGKWSDPKTGNVLVNPKTWQSPDGNMYHITNAKTGAGYWQDPEGFILGSDGVWSNRALGQEIIDGVRYQTGRPLSTRLVTANSGAGGGNEDNLYGP